VSDRDEFYRLRDKRTKEYLPGQALEPRPVYVSADLQTSKTRAGQLAVLSLVNQLARVHRVIAVNLPHGTLPLLSNSGLTAQDLRGAVLAAMRNADPYGNFAFSSSRPSQSLSIGLGVESDRECDWYIGARNSIAHLARSPLEFFRSEGSVRGAALASCLGAAALFRSQLGLATAPRVLSCWNYREGEQAAEGPADLQILDVGRVLMIGAGAVGASLAYWIREFGVGGQWAVVDRDKPDVSNLNRTILFSASDAGWPNQEAEWKAVLAARAISGAVPFCEWYEEYSRASKGEFDVVLCLANEYNVREELACRNHSVLLHATTCTNWLSQLHRHIPGRDDCIFCRVGEVKATRFSCSTVSVGPAKEEVAGDAALPFLSAASGLMLATLLQRLHCGELTSDGCNDWRWDFGSSYGMARYAQRSCSHSCLRVSPSDVRAQLHLNGRWKGLER